MLATIDIRTRLSEVKDKSAAALSATTADASASVVTVAVVREFDTKAAKAGEHTEDAGAARDSVIELEQAADSAKAAAEADPGLGTGALEAVQAAHLAICILKTEV
ncbi:MAG: hypothetical protein ACT4O0_11530 [Pseudonocardia sp.]|jgi:phage-related tail fiber protein